MNLLFWPRPFASTTIGTVNGAVFKTADDTAVAHAQSTTPFIMAHAWDNHTGFGSKFSDPASLPAGGGQSVIWNAAGDTIAIAHTTTPFVTVYPWSSGFGTKYADPSTPPAGNATDVAFHPNSNAIAGRCLGMEQRIRDEIRQPWYVACQHR